MPGSMRQQDGSFELKVYLGRDAVSGRKRWADQTFKGGKRDAQRALAAMVLGAERGGLAHTGATVGELLEEWFVHAAPSFSPKNVVETRGVLDRNLLPFLGTVPPGRHGRPGRAAAVAVHHPPHARHPPPGAEPGSALGWLGRNPASSASPPWVPTPDIRPPSPAQLAKLFAAAGEADPDLADFILLAAATGARRSELVALRWSDVDLDAGRLTVSRGVVTGPAGLVAPAG